MRTGCKSRAGVSRRQGRSGSGRTWSHAGSRYTRNGESGFPWETREGLPTHRGLEARKVIEDLDRGVLVF